MFKSSTEGINSLTVDDVARQAVPGVRPSVLGQDRSETKRIGLVSCRSGVVL